MPGKFLDPEYDSCEIWTVLEDTSVYRPDLNDRERF